MSTQAAIERKTSSFTFTLSNTPSDLSDDEYDAIHSALHLQGCSEDGSFSCEGSAAYLSFDREAADLGDAISSALKAVEKAGYSVTHIEVDRP